MTKRINIGLEMDDEVFEALKRLSRNGDVCDLIKGVIIDGGIERGFWLKPPFDIDCNAVDLFDFCIELCENDGDCVRECVGEREE